MMPKPARTAALQPCLVCGKPCEAWDRNIDGTYAHTDCLRQRAARMTPKMSGAA